MSQIVARQSVPSPGRAASVAVALALVGLISRPVGAATYYWDAASGQWTTGANWSENPTAGGTTGTVPANNTTSDFAVFNQTSVNGNQQVQLTQSQSIAGLTFGNTGSTTIVSDGAAVRTLSIGAGGLMVRPGAGSVTIGSGAAPANVAIDGSQAFTNESSNVLTLAGTVSRPATSGVSQTLSIAGSGTTVISGRLMTGGTAGSLSLSKSGVGTLTFNSTASSVFGVTSLQGGTVLVDFANHATGTDLYSTNGLTLTGGRLLVKGQLSGSTSQSLGAISLSPGGGAILAHADGGSTSVALGTVTPNSGGTLLIGQAINSSGTVTFTRTQAPASSGAAYSQSMVYTNGTGYDWATSTSGATPYVISAFTGYAPLATTAGTDTSQSRITSDTTLTGSRTTNSLKIENPAAGQSLALGTNTLTLTGGALLATGSNAFTITTSGGFISNGGSVIIHQYNTGGLTVAPRFGGGFTSGFTKAGPGTLTLTATSNAFTAPIFINSGTLAIGGAGRLIGTTGTYAGNVAIATDGAFEFASSATSILSGTISGAGSLRQAGSGTTTLSNANTYSGQTRVSTGVLALGVANAIPSQSSVLVDGGAINLAGFNDTVATVTITSGSIFGTGTLAASQYSLQGGTLSSILAAGEVTVSAGTTALGAGGRLNSASGLTISSGQLTLGGNESVANFTLTGGSLAGTGNTLTSTAAYDVRSGGVLANLGGSVGLSKSTSGTVTLAGANTYGGQTTISAGVLALGVNGSFTNSASIRVGDAGSAGAVLDLTAKTAAFSLGAAQTLSGGGTVRVAPAQQFQVQGTFSPGNSPGLFTFDGGTSVLSGTTLIEIFGTSRATLPSHGAGFYDAVNIVGSGTLQLGGNLTLEFSSLFDNNSTFNLFSPSDGTSLSGNFTGVQVGGTFYAGLSWNQSGSIWKSSSTAGGQSLEFNASNGELVIVPEPGAVAMTCSAVVTAALIAASRRRRWTT